MLCHEHQNSSGALPEYTSGRVNLLLHSWPGSNKKANIRIAAIFFEWFRHSFWHTIYAIIYMWHIYSDILSGTCLDILSDILSGTYLDILSGILSCILSGVWLMPGSAHWDLELPVEVWQCPLTWSSQLRSGSAHCDPELAVQIRGWRRRKRRRRRKQLW